MAPPVREHPLARGRLAERANAFLGRAWEKGLLPPPSLDPGDMWVIATKRFGEDAERGGRSAEDVGDFRERFHRLTKAVREEAQLNALGQVMAWGQLNRALANRMKLGALWAKRPDLAETALAPSIIVIGHMRSGTTRIHKLFAADPAHSATRFCDAFHPLPALPGLNRLKSAVELAMLGALNPWLQAIHPMSPGAVEEELAWISAALHHSIYETQWRIPSYSAWSETRDPAPIYREFARILRTDASHRGIADRPRVMKVPAFTEDLPALLDQFPDARLVLATRDTDAVFKSAVSLSANQMAMQSDFCDLAEIEAFWRRKIALREERMETALAHWCGPLTRLHFDAMNEDWETEIARAYKELGLDLTRQARNGMRREMRGNARKFRAHHFTVLGMPLLAVLGAL